MDINLLQAQFPSKGLILDNIAQALGIVLPRKDIQRLIKEEKINPQRVNLLIEQMLDNILSMFFTYNENNLLNKVKTALYSFFEFYAEFILTYETYKVSQKQLNYLLLKDLFIPLAADMCAVIFKEDILILTKIKPTTERLPIQNVFEWIKKRVPYKNEFCKNLEKKHFDAKPLDDESTMRKNLDKWEKGENTPDIESINMLVKYIQVDIINHNDKKNFRNLFLFARIMQKLYMSLCKTYKQEHINLLVEHFYLLLKFYFHEPKFPFLEHLEEFIYNNYFDHINPNIINRNFYWDDYFIFITDVLYAIKIDKRSILKKGMKRNGMLYYMDEKKAFKYMKLFLPVNILNGIEDQNGIILLRNDFNKIINEQNQQNVDMKDPLMLKDDKKINYFMFCLFRILQPNRNKTIQEQKECLKIFSLLKNDFNMNDNNPNICMLKSRYFIYSNEPKKALIYCKKCVENGKGKIGNHFKDVITEGFLLSAKCKRKRDYNFFYKNALLINLFKYQALKIPANSRIYTLIEVSENITDFSQLLEEYDRYFINKFAHF